MVSVVKSNPEAVAVLKKCERQFFSALTSTLSPDVDIQRWIVAHSGGLDSQVLLTLVAQSIPISKILVLHINHHLQDEANSWAEFSSHQASALSLAHQVVDVFPKDSSENAAREARYDAFKQVIQPGDCLLMGHHADDQAETILFRMLRGTGLLGLSGMAASRPLGLGSLLRPLLKCSRAELEQVADQFGLGYIDDPSNQNVGYDRNFLRRDVLPVLKKRWPNLLERWQKNAELVFESQRLLDAYLEGDLSNCIDKQGCLDIKVLEGFDQQKRPALLRYWLYKVSGHRVNQSQLQVIITDVFQAKVDANPVYTLGDYRLRRFAGKLYLNKERAKPIDSIVDDLCVQSEGEYDLGDAVICLSSSAQGLKTLSNVVIRRRKGGERCRPNGRNYSVSVKKMLQEASIPPWYREHWPLLYVGDELVAVPGICICEGWYSEKSGFSVLWRSFSLSECC